MNVNKRRVGALNASVGARRLISPMDMRALRNGAGMSVGAPNSSRAIAGLQISEWWVIAVAFAFWGGWLAYDRADGHTLQPKTYLALGVAGLFFLGGVLIAAQWSKSAREITPSAGWEKRLGRLLRTALLGNIALILYLVPSIVRNGFEHRYMMFEDTAFFGSQIATFGINYLLAPLTTVAVVLAFGYSGPHSRRYKTYGVAMLVLMAVTTIGRFPVYYLIYFLLLSVGFSRRKAGKIRKYLLFACAAAILFIATWILLQSKLESADSRVKSRSEIARIYVLNYHIIGFHMFDQYVKMCDDGIVARPTFPTTSLGSAGWVLHLGTKYSRVLPVFPNAFMDLMDMFNSGMYIDALDWNYNAFTTCLVPIYADGGILGIAVVFLLYGIAAAGARRWLIFGARPQCLLILFLVTFSLFMPFINSELPFALPILWLSQYYIRGFVGRDERLRARGFAGTL